MQKKAKAIPDGYHSVTPYLCVQGAAKAIKFYKDALGAKEVEVHDTPDGKIMHATLKIGDSHIMISDEFKDSSCGVSSPQSLKGASAMLHIYVEDCDKLFNQAVKAGASVIRPVTDQFWGDRYGQIKDPFGHVWSIATHKFDLTKEEVEKGAEEFFTKQSSKACC